MDSLYLQLFQALFPQFNFEDIEPGKTEEEMAENIDQLIKLLETNILEHDLSDIKAENIVGGDLAHIDEFLQVLLQVVFLMIQNQAEGEETEDELESEQKQKDERSSKKHKSDEKYKERLSDDMKDDFHPKDNDIELHSPDIDELDYKDNAQDLYDMDDPNDKDHRLLKDLEKEYDQQLANEGLMDDADLSNRDKKNDKPGKHDDAEDEEPRFSDLDFYGKNPPDHKQVMIDKDEDEEALMMKQGKKNKHDNKASPDSNKKDTSEKKPNQNPKKQEVDVLNDPLLPEGVDFGFKKKNKNRADSLGGGGSFKGGDLLGDQEDDDDLLVIDNLDELEEEQKYMVLQHLFDEYQRNPDSFPEDQKELLEHEMMKLYQKAELEGDLDDEGEFDEDDLRLAASSGKKNKGYSDEKQRNQKWIDEDSDNYDNDPMLQNSNIKAKPRPLNEDDEDSQDDRMNMDGELNIMSGNKDEIDDDSDMKEDIKNQIHNEDDEDEDEKYMKDIIEQQEEAKAEREEEQQKLEANQDEDGEETLDDEDKDDDQAPQPIKISEEEFRNLPPEEQQRMLLLLQQQQFEQQEGEGEDNDQPQQIDPEYLNALQQQQLAQMQRMRTKRSRKSKKKRPSTAKYGWNSRSTRL